MRVIAEKCVARRNAGVALEHTTRDLGLRHADVLGVKVSAVNLATATEIADRAIGAGGCHYICVTGVHGVMEAQSDLEFREILNGGYLNLPDGMPMTWMGWLQGHKAMDRVFGPDFMVQLCQLSLQRGYRHYFYGGKPGVALELQEALQMRMPGLRVVGTLTPPFRPLVPAEADDFVAEIKRLQPDVLWVGLSTPKQERFMAEYAARLGVPLLVGVGAAFDFHTGRVRDCSPWIKRAGFQWLHRLLQDPKRLWRRYLWNNSVFLWRIGLQIFREWWQLHTAAGSSWR